MRTGLRPVALLAAACLAAVAPAGEAPDVAPLLARIKAVGREGAGNADAARAWRELSKAGPAALAPTLAALDDADPVAANWLRAAVDTIAERELAAKKSLPADALEAFVRDTRHGGLGRRLAYEWLKRVDPKAPDRLLPGMLLDPGAELRRDAVAIVLNEAEAALKKGDQPAAAATLGRALYAARDRDQVDLAVKHLRSLGIPVDTAAHYGFIREWKVVGPFDNTDRRGFDVEYPPEKGVDLTATYEGRKEAKLAWREHRTNHAYGLVDLNAVLAAEKQVLAYAHTIVESPTERPVELRAGTKNAVKIFLNGKLVHFRDEYHHGMRMDQHVGRATLQKGKNEILVKVCQNEQTESWTKEWEFQLRLSDGLGAAVPFTLAGAAPAARPGR